MTLTVTFKHPDFPDGGDWDIGLGAPLSNGGSVSVTDAMAEAFEHKNGVSIKEYYKDNDMVKVTEKKGGDN